MKNKRPYQLFVSNVLKRALVLMALLYSSFFILHLLKLPKRVKPLITQKEQREPEQVVVTDCIMTV